MSEAPRTPQDFGWHGQSMAAIAARSQRIVADWMKHSAQEGFALDPMSIGGAFMEMTTRLLANPSRLIEAQIGYWQDYVTLWQNTTRRFMGVPPVAAPAPPSEPRHADAAWDQDEVFDFIKQSYLLSARYVLDAATHAEGLRPEAARTIDGFAHQFVDALSPSNFLLTNPEVLRRTQESGGENLIRGLNNLLADLDQATNRLRAGTDSFKLGETVAATPGAVVFQNALMQLIQYAPVTAAVHARPLLIVPAWINKFYLMDLKPETSLVRYLVAQGHTVFMVSWVNPDAATAAIGLDGYMRDGVAAALDAVALATGADAINAAGYCMGGTLLAAALAARPDPRVKTLSLLASLLDFPSGEAGLADDAGPPGAAQTPFSMRRAGDLVWSFVVNNYLMGKDPFPFDLLYWNADATRVPSALHEAYLGEFVRRNRLPGTLAGLAVPAYLLACKEDHVVPWQSVYAGRRHLPGPSRFVLTGSGHATGVINPPQGGRYNHFMNPDRPDQPEAWFADATEVAGSWWPDWQRWLARGDDAEVPARIPGAGALPVIEPAPGRYVTAG